MVIVMSEAKFGWDNFLPLTLTLTITAVTKILTLNVVRMEAPSALSGTEAA